MKYQKIICLGDSITCDWNSPSYATFWNELAQEKWGKEAITVLAKGRNGEIAQDGYYRVERDVLAEKPDLVTILFGHNDSHEIRNVSPEVFANYIRKTINLIQNQAPKTEIWLLTPNQIADDKYEDRYRPYLDQLQLAAEDKNIKLVNLWTVFWDHDLDEIFTYTIHSTYIRAAGKDWLHPNELGHTIIAQKLQSELEKSVVQ